MFLSWIKNCFYWHCLYRKENKSIQFNSTASCSHMTMSSARMPSTCGWHHTEMKINQFNSTASCSHLALIITLIFVWILSVKDVTWICFRRTFCNIFLDISGFGDGIWYIFVFDLICLFQWIVFICFKFTTLWADHWVLKLDLLYVYIALQSL